ncbi:hypothetical protein SORBI_3008G163900 [Sorghum bicolor]|uniref:F-box domain-containing protein n=1 Tax=Sorghum bicolor TaxID=4558 RepID=A0A1Z5R802_SORBI|nr:hypothetical protein SORBI_3008G163900 [Sorghum bicolor]
MATAADLPVDLVEKILLRLDDAADLVRASAACTAFRRVVTDGRFLRRFRSLHRPPVLGLLSRRTGTSASVGFRFNPAAPPRRSAQAARAVARAPAFSSSSSFLPADTTKNCWHFHDARDGRVLAGGATTTTTCFSSFPYLVVYDPLYHKHVQIPPIPKDDIVAQLGECQFKPFLVPAAAADDDDDLSFRVMCNVLSKDMEYHYVVETFDYSSVTGKWRGVASLSDADYEPLSNLFYYMEHHYAHGCFYWVDSYGGADMLVLDMKEMKFFVVNIPPKTSGNRRLLWRQQLKKKKKTGLACWFFWVFGGAADQGYAVLQGVPSDEYKTWLYCDPAMGRKTNAHCFTVELQTLVVEQLCVKDFYNDPAFLFASFPPPFAPPSI